VTFRCVAEMGKTERKWQLDKYVSQPTMLVPLLYGDVFNADHSIRVDLAHHHVTTSRCGPGRR